MSATTITPSLRFAAHGLQRGHYFGTDHGVALRHASCWESFPRSYSADQIVAAQRLLADPHNADLAAAVLALVSA